MRKALTFSVLPAILIWLVVVGVSSASASVLCKANEAPCSSENVVEPGAGFGVVFLGEGGTFTTSSGNLQCTSGTFWGKVTDSGGEGEPAEAETLALVPGSCRLGAGANCGVTPANAPKALFEGTGGNGSITFSEAPKFLMQCQTPLINCTFSASGLEFKFEGGTPAILASGSKTLGMSGPTCPASATWDFNKFKSTAPTSLFIVGGPAPGPVVRLCKVTTSPCPEANRHPIGTSIEGTLEGNSVFEFLYEGKPREPWCEESTLTGKTTQANKPLIGEVSAMTFKKCGGGVCAVEAQGMPLKAEIEKTTGGNGTLTLATGGGGTPKIEINCGKAFICIYKASGVSFSLTGGEAPKLAVAQTLEKDASSEAECGASMTWKATYKLTKPTPLFVTS